MHRHSTDELQNILNETDSISDLKAFTQMTQEESHYRSFSAFLSDQMREAGISAGDLFRKADIQMNYGYQILNGMKNPGRDKVIALSLALSLQLPDVQRALTLAGQSVLYPKIRRDSILIFCCNHGYSVEEANNLLYEMQAEVLK